MLVVSSGSMTANENGMECIRRGIQSCDGKPFVFLEDDLAFIDRFSDACDRFYNDCLGLNHLILPLCANYNDVQKCRGLAWKYPCKSFYGTQAFIIEPEAAERFVAWCETVRPWPSKGFDILLQRWALHEKQSHFRTPYRSFVQHLGVESSLHNGRFHYYPSWPGHDWRYESSAFPLIKQKKRPFDESLLNAIAGIINKRLPVYDVGCSSGSYVNALVKLGFNVKGFDATPGIEGGLIEEVDFSREQQFSEKPGTVICLEVAEHIHPHKQQVFLENLGKLVANRLILSWAIPGQGGVGHVNEQEPEAVRQILQSHGFAYRQQQSEALMQAATLSWFKKTVGVYDRIPGSRNDA